MRNPQNTLTFLRTMAAHEAARAQTPLQRTLARQERARQLCATVAPLALVLMLVALVVGIVLRVAGVPFISQIARPYAIATDVIGWAALLAWIASQVLGYLARRTARRIWDRLIPPSQQ